MKTLLCLHGSFGSKEDWDFLKAHTDYKILAIDLPGHGETPLLETLEDNLEAIAKTIEALSFDAILAYSLGGRILHALLEKRMINSPRTLIFESANLISLTSDEQIQRRDKDSLLSKKLIQAPEAFFKDWYELPMWALNSSDQKDWAKEKALKKEKHQIWSEALALFSPAELVISTRKTLQEAFYLYGELDFKYKGIATSLSSELHLKELPKSGHNSHKQNPLIFSEALKNILS